MKTAAFKLVATVVIFQMTLIAGTLIGCFVTGNSKCDGSKISDLLNSILASSFALYAAEK